MDSPKPSNNDSHELIVGTTGQGKTRWLPTPRIPEGAVVVRSTAGDTKPAEPPHRTITDRSVVAEFGKALKQPTAHEVLLLTLPPHQACVAVVTRSADDVEGLVYGSLSIESDGRVTSVGDFFGLQDAPVELSEASQNVMSRELATLRRIEARRSDIGFDI